MNITKTLICALVALLLGASACSTGDETEAQIAELSARIVELEADVVIGPELRECISAILRVFARGNTGDANYGMFGGETGTAPDKAHALSFTNPLEALDSHSDSHSHSLTTGLDGGAGHTHATARPLILTTPQSCG